MFGLLEIASAIALFYIYKRMSGVHAPDTTGRATGNEDVEGSTSAATEVPEEYTTTGDSYPSLDDEEVQKHFRNLDSSQIFDVSIRTIEAEIKNRGVPDPRALYWPENNDARLYYARLETLLQSLPVPYAEARIPSTYMTGRSRRMTAEYNPLYSRPLPPQEGLY